MSKLKYPREKLFIQFIVQIMMILFGFLEGKEKEK